MLTPILRLLAIYLAVGLAVFGFFKRDTLMEMFGGNAQAVAVGNETSQLPPAAQAPTSATTPAPEPVFAPTPDENSGVPVPPATPATQPELENQAATTPSAEPEASGDTYKQGLNEARSAYWAGDIRTAIAKYKTLLAHYPDDEGVNGELGNIYLMNGQRREAVTHFEKAGMAALAAGHADTVLMMVGVLRSLDPNAAQRLSVAGAAP